MSASPLSIIMAGIKAKLTPQILELAFLKDGKYSTIDEGIKQEVIRERVLLDVNLVATRMGIIPLKNEWIRETRYENVETFAAYMYNSTQLWIPPQARENRNIASVVRVMSSVTQPGAPFLSTLTGWYGGGNTVGNMGDAILGSHTLRGAGFAPYAINEGNNYIRIMGTFPDTFMDGLALQCTLEYDEEFTNADQNFIYAIRDLCICATKNHIYHKLVISIGESQVVAGMDIGVVKDIVMGFANADDEYDHLLKKVRGAQCLDANTARELIYLQI